MSANTHIRVKQYNLKSYKLKKTAKTRSHETKASPQIEYRDRKSHFIECYCNYTGISDEIKTSISSWIQKRTIYLEVVTYFNLYTNIVSLIFRAQKECMDLVEWFLKSFQIYKKRTIPIWGYMTMYVYLCMFLFCTSINGHYANLIFNLIS